MSWYGYAPYVPVAQRKARGMEAAQKRMKNGDSLQPIEISGSKIATTFWGKSWCTHLEKYSDYANRLPRGRTYARNGSIADLRISKGKITSMVCGTSLYDITIEVQSLPQSQWKAICQQCSSSIQSLMDLMRGKLGDDVIRRITDPQSGMFPAGKEIKLRCSCPDGAYLCKHLAATLYGVGHRLDSAPELLFLLRGVDQNELLSQAITAENASSAMGLDGGTDFVGEDLGAIFGIEMADVPAAEPAAVEKKVKKKSTTKRAAKQKAVKKKSGKQKKSKQSVKRKAVKKPLAKKQVTTRTVAGKQVSKKAVKKKKTAQKAVKTTAVKKKVTKRAAKKRKAVKTSRPRKATPPGEIMIRLN